MNAEPVVSVRMVISVKPKPGLINERLAAHVRRLQRSGDGQRLNDTEDDGQITRVLRDLAASEFALFLQALEVRKNHLHQLQDNGCRDVRHDAQRKNRHLAEIAAAEKVEDAQNRARDR